MDKDYNGSLNNTDSKGDIDSNQYTEKYNKYKVDLSKVNKNISKVNEDWRTKWGFDEHIYNNIGKIMSIIAIGIIIFQSFICVFNS